MSELTRRSEHNEAIVMKINQHECDFNCVSNVVRFIHELQECATTTCGSRLRSSILGAHNNASVANTRPFILYTKTGEPFEAFAPSSSLTSTPISYFPRRKYR